MNKNEVKELLGVRGAEQEALFRLARGLRRQHFGDQAVVRGVVEVTSACVRSCTYCPMRVENQFGRYLLTSDELVESARRVFASGVPVLSIQGGEIPKTTKIVGEAIRRIRDELGHQLEILLVLGDKSHDEYRHLKDVGADSYILKFETSIEELHERHRFYPLADRVAAIKSLTDLNFKVGSGTIVGLPGQTVEQLADDLMFARSLGLDMCSASPFIPAKNTPLANEPMGDFQTTLNAIAVTRILLPKSLIPAVSALQKYQAGGQVAGLDAGANVITVNFTPNKDQSDYPIYGADRFVVGLRHAIHTLKRGGLASGLIDDANTIRGSLAEACT